LLHNQRSIIGSQATEIEWRKAQDSPDRLCIVSNPLPVSFIRKTRFNVQERDGFFAYKLEFHIQTQTGRPQPWVHVFLRCQRYAHMPLTRNTRGNDITLLVGMNQARVNGWDIDTTLVRLRANRAVGQRANWLDSLPMLLANFGARSLDVPSAIYQNPQSFWKSEENPAKDEYYIVHTEGYRYDRYRSGHSVMTGFGLAERSEIIDQTCCTLLGQVLQPDTFLEPDTPIFTQEIPRALWNFSDLADPPKPLTKAQARKQGIPESQISQHREQENQRQRRERQFIPVEGVQRALRGKQLLILIVYRTEDTREALHQQLREAFLLNEGDALPSNVTVSAHPILADGLWQPLDSGSLSPAIRNTPRSLRPSDCPDNFDSQWNTQIRRAHNQKMQAWHDFLRQVKRSAIQDRLDENNFCLAALIELPKETVDDEFHESQSIKGAVREACAREKILSQMIHSVSWTTNRQTTERILPGKEKGRTQNAVQEIVNRQIGALYGTLSNIYQQIGFPEKLAKQLDVIAFCLKTTQMGVRYYCAVRLSASGQIDVLLPEPDPQWYPYAEIGTQVGRIFAAARSNIRNGRIGDRPQSPIRLSSGNLVRFVEDTLTNYLERPTIVLIEAENWRNKGVWAQLKNELLAQMLDRLEFVEDRQQPRVYPRDDAQLSHLLAVIRIRSGDETPQYITNRETWQEDALSRDLQELSGFVDRTINGIFHYFSIGRLPETITHSQARKRTKDPYKVEDGGGVAFKHQQMLELVPFFVHPDFQDEEGLSAVALNLVENYRNLLKSH
jgi:hypothetical protein